MSKLEKRRQAAQYIDEFTEKSTLHRFMLDMATINSNIAYNDWQAAALAAEELQRKWLEAEANADRLYLDLRELDPSEAADYIANLPLNRIGSDASLRLTDD